MLLLSIIGTVFAYYLSDLVDALGVVDWFKKMQLFDLLCVLAILASIVFVIWLNDTVCKYINDKEEQLNSIETHKEYVAEKIRLKKEKLDVY
jgi:H+/Cl- antiporter ClcA